VIERLAQPDVETVLAASKSRAGVTQAADPHHWTHGQQ